jgi:malate synthase
MTLTLSAKATSLSAQAPLDAILTPEALEFLEALHTRFETRRQDLLKHRVDRQLRLDAGELPDFRADTLHIRVADWQVATLPADIQDRRVEITGPVDRKMIINALNCGAKVFMADFEDATTPGITNLLEGQRNLYDRWHGALTYTDPISNKQYALKSETAILMVRPRGWHLDESNILRDGVPLSGALVDFGLYVFHNAKAQLAAGSTPAFYLPKLESMEEAALWNDVFCAAQESLAIPVGTFRATVLIETLPAAFEIDEILYALRHHMLGLNCGRWDYIFSFIKRLGKHARFLTPDRSQMVMASDFLRNYSKLVIQTCHKRGAFAMGGMAAQIPVKNDTAKNDAAFARVRADKEREATDGHDGTWVAHPDLVPIAMEVFNTHMPSHNQINLLRPEWEITQADLLSVHQGTRTEDGLRENIRVGVQYIEAWLRGRGAVPLYNLMEDAATAEISRTQVWQWLVHQAPLEDGRPVTRELVEALIAAEMERVQGEIGADTFKNGRFDDAVRLFKDLVFTDTCPEFLTLPAYTLVADV